MHSRPLPGSPFLPSRPLALLLTAPDINGPAGQLVVAWGDAPKILQSVESSLDAPALLVETLVEAERLLPAGAILE
jgi:hypothetical protein